MSRGEVLGRLLGGRIGIDGANNLVLQSIEPLRLGDGSVDRTQLDDLSHDDIRFLAATPASARAALVVPPVVVGTVAATEGS